MPKDFEERRRALRKRRAVLKASVTLIDAILGLEREEDMDLILQEAEAIRARLVKHFEEELDA